jgi:Ca-activated chloride channel family protein
MWGKMNNTTKKEAAAEVLVKTIDALGADQKIGFMAYGHRTKGDCEDVELLVNLENIDKSVLKSNIQKLNPLGKTPLAYSATLAINAIKKAQEKATIILVTDGIESCNGDLCAVIKLAREEGIAFKLHIVGFGLKEDESESLRCASKEGNGNYYDAKDADQLGQVLQEAVHQKLDDPAPNHTFYTTKNGAAVDAWIKIKDKTTGKDIRGVRTYKDTARMNLPLGEYSLTINPLEGTDIASKTMDISKTEQGVSHHTISFDGGVMEIYVSNNNEGWDATVKVIDQRTQKEVATARTYGRKPTIEVNTGSYTVELFPLNIKGPSLKHIIENVSIKANETKFIAHDYKTGDLLVGVNTDSGELIDAAVTIVDKESKSNIAGGRTYTSDSSNPKRFTLQPGLYDITLKTLGKHKGNTRTGTITVKPGESVSKFFKIE